MPRILWNRSWGFNSSLQQMEITQVHAGSAHDIRWHPTYVVWPRRTIRGRWVWCQAIYQRRIWVTYGDFFHTEPIWQYADIFEMLDDPLQDLINENQ